MFIKTMKQYGKLLGRLPNDVHKYRVELINIYDDESNGLDEESSSPRLSSPIKLTSPSSQPLSPVTTISPDEDWTSASVSTPRSKTKKRAVKSRNVKVVHCKLDDLELLGDPDSVDQMPEEVQTVSDMKPKSTVGIDIEMWRPFEARNFASNYHEYHEEKAKAEAEERKRQHAEDFRQQKEDDGGYCSSLDQMNLFEMLSDEEGSPHPPISFIDHSPPPTRASALSPPIPAQDLVLSVWDFAGQEIYHAAQEAFFAEQSLYIVVWNMNKNSENDMDLCVQFWIDLIQSRAPGSTIIVVATHADEFPKSPRRRTSKTSAKFESEHQNRGYSQPTPASLCERLTLHLKRREEFRKQVIDKNIAQAMEEGNGEELKHLKVLRRNRPKICPVYPVSCTTRSGFGELTDKIISLSTPTKKNPHPFQVNIPITRCYVRVKQEIEFLRRAGNYVVTVSQLHAQLLKSENSSSFEKGSLAAQLSQHSLSEVQDAVSFISGIGEVVWFPSASDNKKSKKTKKNTYRGTSSTDFPLECLNDPVPVMGNRGRSYSSASSGTTLSGEDLEDDERGTWREVSAATTVDRKSVVEGAQPRENVDEDDDVSQMVFLNPHWLMDVLKRVLSHNLIDDFREMTARMSAEEKSLYFGANHLDHAKNGIVRWSLIVDKLIDVKKNFSTEMAEHKENGNKDNVIKALR